MTIFIYLFLVTPRLPWAERKMIVTDQFALKLHQTTLSRAQISQREASGLTWPGSGSSLAKTAFSLLSVLLSGFGLSPLAECGVSAGKCARRRSVGCCFQMKKYLRGKVFSLLSTFWKRETFWDSSILNSTKTGLWRMYWRWIDLFFFFFQ